MTPRPAPPAGQASALWAFPRPWEVLGFMVVLVLLMYSPNFTDGGFNHAETGLYLGNIYAIFQGRVPYRDIFMQFGPLNDYLPALALKLFGPTLYTLRAFFFWSSVLTVLTGWLLALRCLSTRPFCYATGLVLVYEVFSPKWSIYWGGLRHFWGLAVVLALLRCLESPHPRRWLTAAGALCAVALLTSIEVGLFALGASGLFVLLQARHQGLTWPDLLKRLLALAAGWAAVLLPMLLYFAAKGALSEYLRIAFYDVPFNHMAKFGQRRLVSLGPAHPTPYAILAWFFSFNFKMYLPFMAFALGAWQCLKAWRAKTFETWHYAAFLLLAYGLPLYLVSFRQFGGPQSQSGFTAPIILGFMLLERICLQPRSAAGPGPAILTRPRGWQGLLLAVAAVYLLAAQHMIHGNVLGFLKDRRADYALLYQHDPSLRPVDLPSFGGVWVGDKDVRNIVPVVEFLRRHTRPGEPIVVVPESGALHFLADRPNLLRFSTPAMAYTAPRFQEEIRTQLARHPVRIIVKYNKTSGHSKHAGKSDYDLLPSFYDLIESHYHRVADFGSFSILLHKDMEL